MAAATAQMAAILRTGKFLRLFSGVARNLAASSGGKNEETGLVSSTGLCYDSNFLNQANFSIQNVLPYLGVSDSGHAEDRFPTRLLSTPNRYLGRVTRSEIDAMIEEVKASEVNSSNVNILSSQALLAIRLCGSVLDQESQTARTALVNSIWNLVLEKKLPLAVNHYNALLRVHLENKHKFDPAAILEDMKINNVEPDRETYQCFISSYCQEGNIDGASRILQTMKQKGHKVNENIFNSLIIGHSENGDLPRSQGILKVMRQCGLNPSIETYLTLTCAYAKHGDISAMDRVISECSSQDNNFRDGDFLELLFVLCENDHKDQVGKILDQLHPETEEFVCLASHMVVRLVNAGNDDVAYNLLQFTVENSVEDSGKLVSSEFLEQLIRVNTPVSKLLWFLKDMADRKIYTGGIENLLSLSMKNKNIALSMKLADIMISDGGCISKKAFKSMLGMLEKTEGKDVSDNVLACVKIGAASNLMTPDILKRYIFPLLDTWPELCIAQLEEYGLGRDQTVTPIIEFLVGQGKSDMAATVAGIFSEHVDSKLKFMASTTSQVTSVCNHFTGDITSVESHPTPPLTPATRACDQALLCLANQLVEDNRVDDLELLLETKSDLGDREVIYTSLIKLYAKHKLIDRAINLSRRLRTEEEIKLPHFYETLGELIESQYQVGECDTARSSVASNQEIEAYYGEVVPVSTPMGLQYIPTEYHYYYPMQGFYPGFCAPEASAMAQQIDPVTIQSVMVPLTPQELSSEPSNSPSLVSQSCDGFTSPQSQVDQGYMHRQLKRAVASGEADKSYSIYLSLEKSGKVVNVTETSSLIEQLVRADMTREATHITQTMLFRNTHPLPKIFRFLLNKLAVTGSVDDINTIGRYLSTKIKKDVSYDNRLCNAYLSAGRGAEFLDLLVADLEMAVMKEDHDMMAAIQDRFPRGGAMGLLDNHPELLDKFTVLAKEFAKTGYIAPMNVLWTYHFINNNNLVADNIWEEYVKSSNQIMFQKVCQVARSTGNLKLAFGLVDKLSEADQVTPGARGIAYSCLLDCLCNADQSSRGWNVLQDALATGVRLEDINRTALLRLKGGLEAKGQHFPHPIPPKNKRDERSLSPVDWNEM